MRDRDCDRPSISAPAQVRVPSGRDLDGRGLVDFVDRIGERLVELRVVHRPPEILCERAREACDHAMILCQAFASLVPRKAAGEGDHADYPLVLDERRIKVRRARNRQFEHHLAPLRQSLEPLRDLRKKDGLGTRLVLALDRDLGFDDRHWPVLDDLVGNVELLLNDGAMPSCDARLMKERILVPNTPRLTARSSSGSTSGIGFIRLTPSFSAARPLSTLTKGTTPRSSHK